MAGKLPVATKGPVPAAKTWPPKGKLPVATKGPVPAAKTWPPKAKTIAKAAPKKGSK